MPPTHLACSAKPIIGRYLTFQEREDIPSALSSPWRSGIRSIARKLDDCTVRSPGGAAQRCDPSRRRQLSASACTGWHSDRAARRPRPSKLGANAALGTYVEECLAGRVANFEGIGFSGPHVIWKSAEPFIAKAGAGRRLGAPNRSRIGSGSITPSRTMRISHEAIYQSLYIQGRGALRRELTACLRSGRALRLPRERARHRGKPFITNAIMISERPPEIADRGVPGALGGRPHPRSGKLGDWHPCRTLHALHDAATSAARGRLSAGAGYQERAGAEAVREAIVRSMKDLPERFRQSLTWDQGAEMAQHVRLHVATGLQIYSAIRRAHGSAAQMRTPMACCDSTSRKAQISAGTRVMSSMPSLTWSTPDRARPSVGKLLPKHSTSSSPKNTKTKMMFRRPVESALAAAIGAMDERIGLAAPPDRHH